MSETVGIRYEIEGAQESAQAVDALAGAAGRAGEALAESSTHVEGFEGSLTSANEATAGFSALAQEGTQQAIQFSQRLQAAAGAVQALAAAFGGDGEAAGLVARTAQSTVAFAQLGGMLGPQGALVGGIVGAAIPAFQALAASEDGARESARLLTESLGTLITRTQQAYATQAQFDRLSGGGGSIAEQSAFQQQADQRRQLIERALGGDPGAIRELRRMGLTGVSDRDPSAMDTIRSALGGGAQTQLEDGERALLEQLATTAAERTVERTGLLVAATERETERRLAAPSSRTARGSGGGGPSDRERAAMLQNGDDAERSGGGGQASALDGDRPLETERNAARLREQQRQADARAATEAERAIAARRRLEQSAHDERMRMQREYLGSIQDELSALNSAGETLGGVFSSAFQAAIQGQADFGQAMQDGIRQVLLQYGTQMVAEGVGALLTGVGNAIFNPPAAAAKFAEGAGKVALGVGLGAAGAAIPASAASAGRPAEGPRAGAANGEPDSRPTTIIIQQNAPAVMGGTHAEVGRAYVKSARAATLRYGRAA